MRGMSRNKWLMAVVAALAPVLLASCGFNVNSTGGTQPHPERRADPQTLSDVVDGAFFVPGPNMIRAMRVFRASGSIQAVDCGGAAFENIDYTGDRFDQALFPDLQLIEDKNLVEAGPFPSGDRVGSRDACRYARLPSEGEWYALQDSWLGVVYALKASPLMVEVTRTAGTCLAEKSGLAIDRADPAASFLSEANGVAVSGSDWDADIRRFSKIYAECMKPYVDVFRAALLDKRPEYVERNRELLERFAAELESAGYVP